MDADPPPNGGPLQPRRRAVCPWRQDAEGYYLDPQSGDRVCGSLKRKHDPQGPDPWCRKSPRAGGKRCRLHGGNSPRGMASPAWRDGFYSKHLPGGVRKTFTAARDDPDLMNLADDVALYNAHLKELWERLGSGESSAAWEELQSLSARTSGSLAELDAAIRSGDQALFTQAVEAVQAAGRALRALVEKARGRHETWEEIHEVQRLKAATAMAEWRRQVDMRTLIPAEQAMALIMAIMHSVKRNCADVRAQEAVAFDIGTFLNQVRSRSAPAAEPPA